MRTRSDSPNKNCTREGCSKPLRARGLCGTHYNQAQPNRHKKITVACSCCGEQMLRDSSCTRWENTYCGEICRVYHRFGTGWSVDLPTEHWARMYGATRVWPRHKSTHRGAEGVPVRVVRDGSHHHTRDRTILHT